MALRPAGSLVVRRRGPGPGLHWFGFGERDRGLREISMPNLTKAVMLEGCGHWTQQERPAEVNQELLQFVGGLPAR